MKSRVIQGTPVNHVGPAGAIIGNKEGFGAKGTPANYPGGAGTVKNQFEGDQRGNRQVEEINGWPAGTLGTPARSQRGNVDEFSRTRADGPYGVSPVQGNQDLNSSDANGNGVVFDGMARESGYQPQAMAAMDSPVKPDAPKFNPRTIRQENLAHLGQGIGAEPAQAGDDLKAISGGVMSRED